jgi:benzoyl-CoA reductase/2-hydroxyglutaryl-CoA dehydratase subunit BcrC/BadD/HgdB
LLINQVAFYDNPERFTESVNKICDELEERVKKGEGVFPKKTPRLIVSGCPMAVPNWKLPSIIENSGAVIVGEESCVGERGTQNLVDESGESVEALMDAIVDRYFKIDCAIFTPNESRLDHIKTLVKKYNADGVVHYALQFCSPYMIESHPVEQALVAEGIPAIRIETDYSQEDIGQLKTRIEAFIETIKN